MRFSQAVSDTIRTRPCSVCKSYTLIHVQCEVKFEYQVRPVMGMPGMYFLYFRSLGEHTHRRPIPIHHTRAQRRRLQQVIHAHPDAHPAQFRLGVGASYSASPEDGGSLANSSPALLSSGRRLASTVSQVRREQRRSGSPTLLPELTEVQFFPSPSPCFRIVSTCISFVIVTPESWRY